MSNHHRIAPHLFKKIKELSGGERRYLEVLLILSLPVPFVLLDEPFSAIEPIYKVEIQEMINSSRKEKGVILADHDYNCLMDVSDRVVLLDKGVCRWITEKYQLIEFNYLPPTSKC